MTDRGLLALVFIGSLLTCMVIVVTLACLVRLALRHRGVRSTDRSLDFSHAMMGTGMSAMLLPPVLPSGLWAGLFVANSAWLGALALRRRPAHAYLHHLVGALAMAYMFAAARPHSATSQALSLSSVHSHGGVAVFDAHPAGFAFPLVAWVLMIYCLLSTGFAGTDLIRPPQDRPRLTTATELVLSLSMAYMFLTTL
ncbi:DUF5134 domain-containing protein [Saccharopolyspora elongata]|uniref:DUF5134 domain-containing protein n=1 Tax=Saccharopolyspora elongata TaxID=2530387 RepID=A0A4R4Y2V6_9PSEU|nr:DUF5134 domain-containing protein [Saccharopolyspora elongata]TDD37182.1 DUF5134 domain-containing protein [Saccharopolyspora elongata]